MTLALIVLFVGILGIMYSSYNYFKIKRMDEGTERMSEIAAAIREGANTFLMEEYKVLFVALIVVTLVLGIFIQPSSAVAFIVGTVMSGAVGLFGMHASTYANVRVANTALETKNIGKTTKVALRGGSVMGISVAAAALIGLVSVIMIYKGQLQNMGTITNWCGISFEPFSMTLSSYALGCSLIAMFNRVGGGIYTKAADMGADLVGKNEENIPEDDPRNPAVIADCVGDNVGDTAGLGSDLLESFMGSVASSIVFIVFLYNRYQAMGLQFSESLFQKLWVYPIVFTGVGLIASMLALAYVFLRKDGEDPHKELNIATWMAAGVTAGVNLVFSIWWFKGESFGDLPFILGALSPFAAALFGIIAGIAIGMITEYYTSYDFKPTRMVAAASKEGAALTITQGMSVGSKSVLGPMIVIGIALELSYAICGFFGISMAAVGMLSFVGVTVSVDTYGPISDNAGGIAEMAELGDDVREITDKLDSVGNTTAAMGKGFAIGSASFATSSLMFSYLFAFAAISAAVILNIMDPLVLVGLVIGVGITSYFSGILIEAVASSAEKMVDEVRRQFREIHGLRRGQAKPDYNRCIAIATKGALAEMKTPALISILVPVVCGFLFGPNFVGGLLFGATLFAIQHALYCGNAGGAWDNSKKYIEAHGKKGSYKIYA